MKKYLFITLVSYSAFGFELPILNPLPDSNTFNYQLDLYDRLDGKSWGAEHNVQVAHKFLDGYKLSGQGDFYTNYQYNKIKQDFRGYLKERYFRAKFESVPFAQVMGFRTSLEVRYHLPIDDMQQKAGSFGIVAPRLLLYREFSPHFNLMLIPKAYVQLNRRSYQIYGTAPNELGGIGFEMLPQWIISPGFTLTYDPEFIASAVGQSPSKEHVTYTYQYDHEMELLYRIKSWHNLGIGPLWRLDYYFFGNHLAENSQSGPFRGFKNRVGLRLSQPINF